MLTDSMGTMWRLWRTAAAWMDASSVRSASSWQALILTGYEPYLVQHTSDALPHRTAMSVAVTASRPPSATACTAASRSVHGVP
jgi:hypothetical protein